MVDGLSGQLNHLFYNITQCISQILMCIQTGVCICINSIYSTINAYLCDVGAIWARGGKSYLFEGKFKLI